MEGLEDWVPLDAARQHDADLQVIMPVRHPVCLDCAGSARTMAPQRVLADGDTTPTIDCRIMNIYG